MGERHCTFLRLTLGDGTTGWAAMAAPASSLEDLDGKVIRQFEAHTGWSNTRDYVHRDAQLFATILPSGAVQHYHLDHLGTPRLVTDASKAAVANFTYFPFGEEVAGGTVSAERVRFTGHERDLNNAGGAGDDLDYMHARYCSPVTGRFLGVDPAGGKPQVPQSWNRYSYVRGRTLVATDPTGRDLAGIVAGLAIAALQAAPNDSSDLSGFLSFLGISRSISEGAEQLLKEYASFLVILDAAMPGAQFRHQAAVAGERGDMFSEALFNSMADLAPETSGQAAMGALPIGHLRLAKKLKISATSPTGRRLLENLGLTVEEFVSKFRKAGVNAELPGEFRHKTVLEALLSGEATVRKLLTDGRFAK